MNLRKSDCSRFRSYKGILSLANHRNNGFTLIEVMVAMVIGLLGVIVIMQVFSLFEGQKRSTTGGADAQNNGAIALYGIQRDIRQSGWNLMAPNLIGCKAQLPAGTSGVNLPLAPVTINSGDIPAGDPNTDTLLVYYGSSNGASEGDVITAQPVQQQYGVNTISAFTTGDYVVAEPAVRPNPCTLNIEKATIQAPNLNVQVPIGVPPPGASPGNLYNLGSSLKILAYAIRNGRLTVCDYFIKNCASTSSANLTDTTIWEPISDNIVSMRVQYGRDTSAKLDGIVDIYDQVQPVTNCDWLKVSSIQIALVSRSSQPEKDLVTNTTSTNTITWRGQQASLSGAPPPAIISTPIDLTGIPTTIMASGFSWQNYRYKVFQTVVPLRNITSILAISESQCNS
ncbi:PilW family protein [Methyloradius palustris]|uniref:Type IV pilus assembly protein PilW n=1 Tax=Methyloradius palustris TaxID=2778876 RepID=A0A8D5G1I9_9PROT|nr:PilW family protein [Methyloradius palustris]BCM26147.1 hypothetical protein ZMTM_24060 [Methyloradius palustris]